jgi:hypothetical protein
MQNAAKIGWPEFYSNTALSSVSLEAHHLAGALLLCSDEHGYFNATHVAVKGAAFPLRETDSDIPSLLVELEQIGYIEMLFSSDGQHSGRVVHKERNAVPSTQWTM